MSKNLKILLISVGIIIVFLCILVNIFSTSSAPKNTKITIVTTIFPTYDFAKAITGNLADVSLVIKPGTESHSYEPSIMDITDISSSTLFIYTGENLEPWTASLLKSLPDTSNFIDISKNIILIENDDEDEDLAYDPHIWMSLKNAQIIAKNIYDAIANADSLNIETYKTNYELLIDNLEDLDKKYENLTKENEDKTLVFASPFSYIYLTKEYNLKYISAYAFCSEHSEPSINDVKKVIDFVKENNVKFILSDKLLASSAASAIKEETSAEIAFFNSIHNISKDDLENNLTYVDFMTENLESMKKAFDY